MEKFLIIGGTGNIGFPLIEFLNKQKNVQIVAGSHNPDKAQEKFQDMENVVVKKFDFLDNTTFADAFDGVSKVFFVRPPQLGHPKQDMLPFLRYAQNHAIDQIVFVSLLGVEKNPMTPHHQIEQMILELNIRYTFISTQHTYTTSKIIMTSSSPLAILGQVSSTPAILVKLLVSQCLTTNIFSKSSISLVLKL